MTFETIFAGSGLALLLLIAAKTWEVRTKRSFFILRWISKGDEAVHTLSHKGADAYSLSKEHGAHLIKKQLPLHAKNLSIKTASFVKERSEELFGNIRGSRFLKKNDGISEFFKSISEKEEGRIDETLSDRSESGGDK